jgi:hypothetical protein
LFDLAIGNSQILHSTKSNEKTWLNSFARDNEGISMSAKSGTTVNRLSLPIRMPL